LRAATVERSNNRSLTVAARIVASIRKGTENETIMRVLVNGLAAAGPMTGIGHYTTQLLRCLRQQTDGEEIRSFPNGWLCRARSVWARVRSRLERDSGPAPVASANPLDKPKGDDGWRDRTMRSLRASGQWLLARNFRAAHQHGGYDLYHEPNFIPLPSDLPTLATLHDLSVLLHPEWHPADRVAHFERRFRRGLKQCVHFLAISESARQEILRTLNLRPEQVTRTYMGIRPGLAPLPEQQVQQSLRRLGLPPRYLLYVGTIEPRKNLLTLLHAYRALDARIRRDFPLVLVGGWGWNSADVARLLDAKGGAPEVIHLGYVPDRHMAALYNGARALVFPSFYEGFGLPPVEMLACGGAVLASTADAVVETVGRQAHLIEPLDLDGWRQAMQRVVSDDDWWRSLRRGAVETAKPFTWEQCAADTLRVYRQLCGGAEKSTNHIQTRHKIAG
jgi:glycosyltransferase involved in cell wall biosynthesis